MKTSPTNSAASYDTYIIIHGTKGSPADNWFPWLTSELRQGGARVFIPHMPTPQRQCLDEWLSALNEQVESINERTCLIGHSIGATFLLRYLERCRNPVGGSVFVAGLTGIIGHSEYDELNRTFIDKPYDWESIRRCAGRVLCFAGDNDPYVPLRQSSEIAEQLGIQLRIISGGGHLNSESGYNSFEELLHELVGSSLLLSGC